MLYISFPTFFWEKCRFYFVTCFFHLGVYCKHLFMSIEIFLHCYWLIFYGQNNWIVTLSTSFFADQGKAWFWIHLEFRFVLKILLISLTWQTTIFYRMHLVRKIFYSGVSVWLYVQLFGYYRTSKDKWSHQIGFL